MVSSLRVASSLALLWLLLHLIHAEQPAQRPLTTARLTPEQRAAWHTRGGNDLVHQTWAVLRQTEPTWRESSVIAGGPPSGISATAWYYTKLVFRALFMNTPVRDESGRSTKLSAALRAGVENLNLAADNDDPDAIYLLAEMNFYGNFSHPRNFNEAFRRYEQLADIYGNATAQHMLGLMYATGIGGAVEKDQAKALLYHTFAAEQGDVKSEMTLAFRHHQGVGTGRSCSLAAEYYKRVADKAMDWWQSGPPGGHRIQSNAVRWAEYEGGVYGEGASFSSSGPQAAKEGSISASFDDLLELLDMRERQGDWGAVLALGKYYYEAPRGYKSNFKVALKKFNKINRAYWADDLKVRSNAPKGIEKVAGKAAGYIGRMYLRGEGVEQNFKKAMLFFRRGVINGDAYSQYHMGLMYRDGLGVPRDGTKAGTYLNAAAEQDLPIAQSAVGVLFLDQGDVETAGRYFEHAASAHVMEGYYYLAELTSQGLGGRNRNCDLSVVYYKVVAERAEQIHSSFAEANSAFERGDLDRALVAAIGAAEQGYENAQANVAFLLDQKSSVIDMPSIPLFANPLSPTASAGTRRSRLLNNPSLALVYYTRSARQQNIDSLIKMGDYYLTGVDPNATLPVTSKVKSDNAVSDNIIYRDLDKAGTCYTTAAEKHHSAQALWNLGWMHENGIGNVEQDFHMAKRYYDLALEMNKEAYLPVKLALLKLRLRSWWNGVSGGTVKSMGSDEDDRDRAPKSFWEWLHRFLDAAEEMEAQEYAELQRRARDGDDDGLAYGETGMPGGDADYHYDGTDDYLGDIDDGLVESLIIVALAGALAMLMYARQQRQRDARERREREDRERLAMGAPNYVAPAAPAPAPVTAPVTAPGEQQQQQQPQGDRQDGGLFPQPGDPEYANWVAGGIGH